MQDAVVELSDAPLLSGNPISDNCRISGDGRFRASMRLAQVRPRDMRSLHLMLGSTFSILFVDARIDVFQNDFKLKSSIYMPDFLPALYIRKYETNRRSGRHFLGNTDILELHTLFDRGIQIIHSI